MAKREEVNFITKSSCDPICSFECYSFVEYKKITHITNWTNTNWNIHYTPYHSRWQGEFDVIVWYNANKTEFSRKKTFIFLFVDVDVVPLLYSRSFGIIIIYSPKNSIHWLHFFPHLQRYSSDKRHTSLTRRECGFTFIQRIKFRGMCNAHELKGLIPKTETLNRAIDRSSLISHKFGICQLRIADGTILIADYSNLTRKTIDNKNGFFGPNAIFIYEKRTKQHTHRYNVMHDEFICFGSQFVIIQNDRNLLFFRCFLLLLFSSSAFVCCWVLIQLKHRHIWNKAEKTVINYRSTDCRTKVPEMLCVKKH